MEETSQPLNIKSPKASSKKADSPSTGQQSEKAKSARSEHLCQQAVILFDRTRPLHDLGDDSRLILEMAARLRNQLIPHARKKPYKAALAFVRTQPAARLAAGDERVLAAVLAYHQKKIRRKEIDRLELSPIQVRQVLTIAALLQIAVGLNSSGGASTRIQSVEQTENGMWIIVDGPGAASDAVAAQHNTRLWVKIGYPTWR